MEIVEGKPNDKKIIVAQEIAFAKVLAGNNKVLRDRALKKLKKWLTVRGTGKWGKLSCYYYYFFFCIPHNQINLRYCLNFLVFSEEEFIRIWTGLFYCMWMSDKFLVQVRFLLNIIKKSLDIFIYSFIIKSIVFAGRAG